MAKIEKFEDIISWQESRKLNKIIGDLIDGGSFKRSYRLISRSRDQQDRLWIILLKVLKEVETGIYPVSIYVKRLLW